MPRVGIILISAFLAGTVAARAADPPDPKGVLERAVAALGGRERLAKFKAASWKGHGTYFGLGKGTRYTGVWQVQPPDRARIVLEGELDGRKFERTMVVNGDRGWVKIDGVTEALRKEALLEEKETLYASWVACVVPLLDSTFELAPLGVTRVNGRPAAGIKVTTPGHREVVVYFDEATGLPVQSDVRTRNLDTGKEALHEVFFSEYRDFHGIRRPRKTTVKWDGVVVAEGEIEEFKPSPELPAGTFSEP